MGNKRLSIRIQLYLKRLLQYFLQGLLVMAPVSITFYVIYSLFNMVDGFLPSIIHSILPKLITKDADGNLQRIPGIGFVVFITLVIIVGRISSSFIVTRLVDILDKVLENTPGIKFIYTSVKDFLEAFAGNKKKFDKPVLVNVDANDVWRVGFITQADASAFELIDHIVVYVPHSYAISGITYIVPKEKVIVMHNITPAEAMKFTVSGGVSNFVD
ncbi:MAG: DUF502 domain-containing protein [Bacteroidota bacterium]